VKTSMMRSLVVAVAKIAAGTGVDVVVVMDVVMVVVGVVVVVVELVTVVGQLVMLNNEPHGFVHTPSLQVQPEFHAELVILASLVNPVEHWESRRGVKTERRLENLGEVVGIVREIGYCGVGDVLVHLSGQGCGFLRIVARRGGVGDE